MFFDNFKQKFHHTDFIAIRVAVRTVLLQNLSVINSSIRAIGRSHTLEGLSS